MTQASHPNPDRLDRLEAIVLELATASIRHDNEFSRINATLDRITEKQDRIAEQQDRLTEQQNRLTEQQNRLTEQQNRLTEQQMHTSAKIDANAEQIAQLTAGLLELRHLVSNYIQGRSDL